MIALALTVLFAIQWTPGAVPWTDGPPTLPPGTKIAVLEGNPASEGMFTIRLRVPAGTTLAPHTHPADERVTVLSGVAEVGFGTTADRAVTKRFGAGSFYVNHPGTPHFLFFPEETVLQLTCEGPWKMDFLE